MAISLKKFLPPEKYNYFFYQEITFIKIDWNMQGPIQYLAFSTLLETEIFKKYGC